MSIAPDPFTAPPPDPAAAPVVDHTPELDTPPAAPAPAAGSLVRYRDADVWHFGLVVAGADAATVQVVPLGTVTVHPVEVEAV